MLVGMPNKRERASAERRARRGIGLLQRSLQQRGVT
jgi:hypothetical protein